MQFTVKAVLINATSPDVYPYVGVIVCIKGTQ